MEPATTHFRLVVYEFLFRVALGIFGTILAGLFLGDASLFGIHIRYVMFCGAAAFLFAFYRARGLMESLYVAALCSLILSLFIEEYFVERLGHLTFFLTLTCFSFFGIWRLLGRILPFGKFLLLGLAFWGIEFLIAPVLGWLLESPSFTYTGRLQPFLLGVLGLGLGTGLETAEAFLRFMHKGTGQHRIA